MNGPDLLDVFFAVLQCLIQLRFQPELTVLGLAFGVWGLGFGFGSELRVSILETPDGFRCL